MQTSQTNHAKGCDIKMRSKRNSTLEVLRIISMMMVIGLHYMNVRIGGGLNTERIFNKISDHIIESICITSVNIFVLISGYFIGQQNGKESMIPCHGIVIQWVL